jgi:hypothetical protein
VRFQSPRPEVSLDVAQKESAWSGTTRPLVRFQPFRRIATDPRTGHETTNLVGWGSNPLGGPFLDVAQKQSAWVTTTMSLVQSQSSRLNQIVSTIPPFHGGTRFCEGRWLRFESSRWCLSFTSPSGTVLDSKSGEAVFDSLAACFARIPSGPPCGVTAAGGISGLVTRRNLSSTCSPAARALGSDPRDRWCKSSHVDQVIWV